MTATEVSRTATGTVTGERKERYARYDGLRGICALFVILYHIGYQAGVADIPGRPGPGIWGELLPAFRIFLPPFFVLSGVLLYRSFARAIIAGTPRPAAGPFILGRALRLLPAFWLLTLVVMLTLNLRAVDGVWYVLKPFLLLHYWLTPEVADWMPGMEHTWTVPVEMSYYVALPVLALLINRYARRGADPAQRARRMLVPFILMGVLGILWTVFAYLPAVSDYTFYYIFWPFGYATFFAAGMAMATVSEYRDVTSTTPAVHKLVARWPHVWWLGALAALVFNMYRPTLLSTDVTELQPLTEYTLFFIFGVCMVLPLTVPEVRSRFFDAVLTNRPIRYTGRLSYGVYLWNVPIMYYYFQHGNIFGDEPLGLNVPREPMVFSEFAGFTLFVFVGTAVAVLVSYYLLERPALRLRRSLGAPRSALELGYSRQAK